MANYDAIVVGGGIVGMATGYHLARAGVRTLLLDRADPGRASDAGAGILAAGRAQDDPDPLERFAARAVLDYAGLIEALDAAVAGPTGYGVIGALTVALDDDELAPFEELRARRSSAADADVGSAQAQAMFPPLALVRRALHSPGSARIDGRLLVAALRRAAEALGLVVRAASVEGLVVGDGAVEGVVVAGDRVPAGQVVIAAGAWSAALGEQLALRIPVAPQRGQIVHLRLPGVDTTSWPIVGAFRGHYMVPWPDGRVVVGATRETGSGFRPETTAQGILQVLAEALRVAPGLQDASLHEIRVGLRPASADGLPILGPVPGLRNLLLATGHGPVGLQLGPYSGRMIAEIVSRGAPSADLTPFRVERFW